MAIENLKQDFYIDYFLAQEKPQVDVQARKTCLPPCHPFTINTARKRNSEIQVWESFSCAKLELNMAVKMLLLDANFQIPAPFLCHFFKKNFWSTFKFFCTGSTANGCESLFSWSQDLPSPQGGFDEVSQDLPFPQGGFDEVSQSLLAKILETYSGD